MAELDRAQAERLDGAPIAAALDVLADAEGVVEKEEHAADDVLDQRLGAEADGDADDAGAGDQRADVDAERRQRHQHRHHRQHDERNVAQDWQQCPEPRPPTLLLAVRLAGALRLAELAVDQRLDDVPEEIGDQHDDDDVEGPAQEPRRQRVARGDRHQVQAPGVGQQKRGADDEGGAKPAAQDHRMWGRLDGGLAGARRSQDVIDGALHRRHRRRQADDDDGKPERAHRARHPRQPQQHEIGGEKPCAGGAADAVRRRRRVCRPHHARPSPHRLETGRQQPEAE